MADTALLSFDASTLTKVGELPWSGMQRSRLLSGAGQLTCALPVGHPQVSRHTLGLLRTSPDRLVAAFRDGSLKWAGFISGSQCRASDGVFNLVAREFPWILAKRFLEQNKDFDGMDVFDIFRWLVTYLTTKQGTGDDGMTLGDDIVAAMPYLAVDPASADSGTVYTFANSPTVYGTDRKSMQEIVDLLNADPETGFEYRTSYAGSTWLAPSLTFELGCPTVGATLTREMTQWIVADYGKTIDGERGGTRFHGMSSEGPVTRQSASMVANGALLLEQVEDLTDVPADVALGQVKEIRRLSRSPGPRVPDAVYIPDDPLPYGFCDIGDTWPFNITEPDVLRLTSDTRRVVQEDVTCDVDGSELVGLTYNEPVTDLGG